jgi:D-3-phosphoglycerate dehydrogenase
MTKAKVVHLSRGTRPEGQPLLFELPADREEWRALRPTGAEVYAARCTTQEEQIEAARDADVIMCGTDASISRRLLESMEHARAVIRAAIGVDNIDLEAARELGIVVANNPDFCIEEVANHAIMLLLACAKKLTILHNQVAAGNWDRSVLAPMGTLYGQTLALVGFGRLAQATARKAQAFNLRVIAYDPYADKALAWAAGVQLYRSDLHKVLSLADYVSIHTALTEETRHMIGEVELAAMKSSAYMINTSRGAVIDEQALIKALQQGRLAGAGLDVFENEPPDPDNPLLQMPNVTKTAHSASFSDAAAAELRLRAGEDAARVLKGRWPLCVANPGVKPRIPLR